MTLCDRLIGGVVNLLADTGDMLASFWQTPREVEWAKAAADGLAEREAEEEVWSPPGGNMQTVVLSTEVAEPTMWETGLDHPCSLAADFFPQHTKTSAPTPGAVDGPAEGSPDKPSAGVRTVCGVCFRPSGNCDCVERLLGPGPAFSAEVEPPASAPSAESRCVHGGDPRKCGVESPAPEFDWVTTAIPVIAGVLSEHVPEQHHFGPVLCHDSLVRVHAEFVYWQEWHDHVAPLIAVALQTPRSATSYDFPSGDRPRPLADFPKHQ